MKIKNKEKFIKHLFLYRSLLFKFTFFESDIDDKELQTIIEGLNIKNRYKRIYFIVDKTCVYIDEYYNDKNMCKFSNSKCICHRKKNLNYNNGCCRKCKYQSNKGCTTKNVACKMFYCSYAKENIKLLDYKDIKLLKLLNFFERLTLQSDYFASIDEVTKDIYYGMISDIIRMPKRFIELLIDSKKNI